jgi:Zn-dependent alcohol dehydrogenase
MTVKAKGAIARIPDRPVVIEEFALDDPGPRDVVVKILASGVCHTDLGIKTGT